MGRVRLRDRLRPLSDEAFARGTLWHAWLEQIEWLDEGPPHDGPARGNLSGGDPNDELLRTIAATIRHGINVEDEMARFRAALRRPEVRRVLSRQAYADPRTLGLGTAQAAEVTRAGCELGVHRERRFAVRDAGGLLSGSIDRLVLLTRDQRVLAADVIDFKTDRVAGAAELDEKVEFYRPQIAAYCLAAARLYRLEPEQVAARLVFVETGAVRPIVG